MSLQIWMPLTEDLHNQGLLQDAVITQKGNSSTFTNYNGKIGRSAVQDGGTITVDLNKEIPANKWSCCLWVYADNDAILGYYNIFELVPKNITDTLGSFKFATHNKTSDDTHHFYVDKNILIPNKGIYFSNNNYFTPEDLYNQWRHICFVCDGETVSQFIDGIKIRSVLASSEENFITQIKLAAKNQEAENIAIYKNDFRFYDHALSQKEIKEISKGLYLHYKLGQDYMESPLPENLITNSKLDTRLPDMTGLQHCNKPAGYSFENNSLKIQSPTTGGNDNTGYLFYWNQNDLNFSPGDIFTFSAELKGDCQAIALYFCKDIDLWYSATTATKYSFTMKRTTEDWIRFSVTGKVPQDNNDFLSLGFHCGFPDKTLYVRNVKLEKGTIATPWCPHKSEQITSFTNWIETDLSGFNHNGVKNGNFLIGENAPRQLTYKNFTGPFTFVEHGPLPPMSNATYCFWAQIADTDYSSYRSIYRQAQIANSNNVPWLAINNNSSGVWSHFNDKSTKGANQLTPNKWHFFTYTWNNGISKIYCNGEFISTQNYSDTILIIPNGVNGSIGHSYSGTSHDGALFTGSLSDFRIYATTLTDEDIKELYQTAAVIDNHNNLYTYNFVEERDD